jgi:hypothetical protein
MVDTTLFPTEAGAAVNPSTLLVSSSSFGVNGKPKKKKARKQASLEDAILAEKTTIAFTTLTPRQRWIWAIKRVRTAVRIKNLGIGVTSSRVAKSKSLLERIERIENEMVSLPYELKTYTDNNVNDLSIKLTGELQRVEEVMNQNKLETIENCNRLQESIITLDGQISTVATNLATLQEFVEEQARKQSGEMQKQIDELFSVQNEMKGNNLIRLNKQFLCLQDNVNSLEFTSEQTKTALKEIADANAKYLTSTNEDALSHLLKADSKMRMLRENLYKSYSGIYTLGKQMEFLKTEFVNSSLVTSDDLTKCDKVTEEIEVLIKSFDDSMEYFKHHDGALEKKWTILSQMITSIKSYSTLPAKVERCESVLEDKVTDPQAREISHQVISASLGPLTQPLEAKIADLSGAVVEVQGKVNEISVTLAEKKLEDDARSLEEEKKKQLPESLPAHSNQNVNDVLNILQSPNASVSDVEGQLQPIVTRIVKDYMERWENGENDDDEEGAYEEDGEGEGDHPDYNVDELEVLEEFAKSIDVDSHTSKSNVLNRKNSTDTVDSGDGLGSKSSKQSKKGVKEKRVLINDANDDPSMVEPEKVSGSKLRNVVKKAGRYIGESGNAEALKNLQTELVALSKKIDRLNVVKMDAEEVFYLMGQKADTQVLKKKADMEVIEAIEGAVKGTIEELGNYKSLQESESKKLKSQLEKKIRAALQNIIKEQKDANAHLSLASHCLSCGQASPTRVKPYDTPAAPFLPQLNVNSTTGPDVYRGGFKMPVTSHGSRLESLSAQASGSTFQFSPRTEDVKKDGENYGMQTSKANIQVIVHKPVTVSGGLEEMSDIRPIFRKGFPGKKSERAVVSIIVFF